MWRSAILVCLTFLLGLTTLCMADIPKLINYQGMLTDQVTGDPVTNPGLAITFRIYNHATSTDPANKKWEESHSSVAVTKGLFNVILGSQSKAGLDLDFSEDYWLEIVVGGEVTGERLRFTSVGYAYHAKLADSAAVAGSGGGGGGGWADDGTVVRLETGGDSVAIGTTDPKYKTDITIGPSGGTALRLRSSGTTAPMQTILRLSNTTSNDASGNYSSYIAGVRTNSPSSGAQALAFGTSGSSSPPTERMRLDSQGRLGIGTTSPQHNLDVAGNIRTSGSLFIPSADGRILNADSNAVLQTAWSSDFWDYTAISSGYEWTGSEPYSIVAGAKGFFFTKGAGGSPFGSQLVVVDTSGRVGIGTTNPGSHKLYVNSSGSGASGSTVHVVNTSPSGLAMTLDNTSSDVTLLVSQHGSGPILRCDSWTGGWHPVFKVQNDGRVVCSELQLTGGSDLSEQFDIEPMQNPKPGMIVCIDPENPGYLVISKKCYDRTVVGIISGAGGIQTGVLMGQAGSRADGSHPVALTGRVYCWADASQGSIYPGDLLTTSDRPGHAMKVKDHARAQGAIIGKAMSSLEQGVGLVLVLVTLQ